MLQFSHINKYGRGEWIADVVVIIIDSKRNEILKLNCDGPMMLINLKPGRYEITSSYLGIIKKNSIIIQSKKLQKLSIFWR